MSTKVTFKGNPLELAGTPPQVGDQAPAFTLIATDLSGVSLSDSDGKIRVISVVPSVDTPVCSIQTARFNKELDSLPDSVVGYTVSVDTPFAQKRWCAAEGVEKIQLLSDYKGNHFGHDWGLYLPDLGLLARAVYIVDGEGRIAYAQLVSEVTHEPNYEEVISKAKELAS